METRPPAESDGEVPKAGGIAKKKEHKRVDRPTQSLSGRRLLMIKRVVQPAPHPPPRWAGPIGNSDGNSNVEIRTDDTVVPRPEQEKDVGSVTKGSQRDSIACASRSVPPQNGCELISNKKNIPNETVGR